jgi:rhodanese-related sulfurtransferase
VDFIQNNILLIVVAFASGAMLIWPLVRRGAGGPWVSATQATHLINREDALVVDVREPGEYGAGHILGAKNVPLARLGAAPGELGKKKDRPVIIYCESGNRSAKALAALKAQGFTRTFNLAGGLDGWRQAGLPVEK